MKLNHVGIACRDSVVSAGFYVQLFKGTLQNQVDHFLPLSQKREPNMSHLCDVTVGEVRLHLLDICRSEKGAPTFGLDHLCFQFSTFNELLECLQRYREIKLANRFSFAIVEDCVSEFQVRPDESVVCYIRDPDGNELELMAPAPRLAKGHIVLRAAMIDDLDAVERIVEEAYRESDQGWTSEKSLVTGRRAEREELEEIIRNPCNEGTLLVYDDDGVRGCILVSKNRTGHFGMFAVDPRGQNMGVGKQLLSFAEIWVRDVFGSTEIEAQVLSGRDELLRYYRRRGYELTGDEEPFVNPQKLLEPRNFLKIRKTLM